MTTNAKIVYIQSTKNEGVIDMQLDKLISISPYFSSLNDEVFIENTTLCFPFTRNVLLKFVEFVASIPETGYRVESTYTFKRSVGLNYGYELEYKHFKCVSVTDDDLEFSKYILSDIE